MKVSIPGLVEVCVYSNQMEAEIAKGVLEENEILAFIVKDDCGGIQPQLQITEGIRLLVREQDEHKAQILVKCTTGETQSVSDKMETVATWTCTNCGEISEEQFTDCWNCSTSR